MNDAGLTLDLGFLLLAVASAVLAFSIRGLRIEFSRIASAMDRIAQRLERMRP